MKYNKDERVVNLLLAGPPGHGKSRIIDILVLQELLKKEVLTIELIDSYADIPNKHSKLSYIIEKQIGKARTFWDPIKIHINKNSYVAYEVNNELKFESLFSQPENKNWIILFTISSEIIYNKFILNKSSNEDQKVILKSFISKLLFAKDLGFNKICFVLSCTDKINYSKEIIDKCKNYILKLINSISSKLSHTEYLIIPIAVNPNLCKSNNIISPSLSQFKGQECLLNIIDSFVEDSHNIQENLVAKIKSIKLDQRQIVVENISGEIKKNQYIEIAPMGIGSYVVKIIKRGGKSIIHLEDKVHIGSNDITKLYLIERESSIKISDEFVANLYNISPGDISISKETFYFSLFRYNSKVLIKSIEILSTTKAINGQKNLNKDAIIKDHVISAIIRLIHPIPLNILDSDFTRLQITLIDGENAIPVIVGFITENLIIQKKVIEINDQWIEGQIFSQKRILTPENTKINVEKEPKESIIAEIKTESLLTWSKPDNHLEVFQNKVNNILGFILGDKFSKLYSSINKFENLQYLLPLFTEFKRPRDHFLHQLRVAVLGDYLLDTKSSTRYTEKKVTLASYICKLLKNTQRYQRTDINEDLLKRTWWFTALYHDSAYPLLSLYSPICFDKKVQDVFHDIFTNELFSFEDSGSDNYRKTIAEEYQIILEKHKEIMVPKIIEKFTNTLKLMRFKEAITKEAEKYNHGLIGAYNILSKLKNENNFHIDLAAEAVALHELKLPSKAIRFTDFPLGFLLILTDEMQEWGRPIPVGKQQELENSVKIEFYEELNKIEINLCRDGDELRFNSELICNIDYSTVPLDILKTTGLNPRILIDKKQKSIHRLCIDTSHLPKIYFNIKFPKGYAIEQYQIDIPVVE